MSEIWRPVKGYEGFYEVSNWARVKSLNYRGTGKEQLLKPYKNKGGYCNVDLSYKGIRARKSIHRLVAESFIPNPEDKSQVDHINKQRDDNRVENLQWLTVVENQRKSWKQGRVQSENNRQATKNSNQIISIWINEGLNLEFMGSSYDLVRAFPDQKLCYKKLSLVRKGERRHHKNWRIKI